MKRRVKDEFRFERSVEAILRSVHQIGSTKFILHERASSPLNASLADSTKLLVPFYQHKDANISTQGYDIIDLCHCIA